MIIINDTTRNWPREKMHMKLMRDEPQIAFTELERIICPVLVMASDKDIIKLEHILKIYQHIKNSHLFIMPGATHFMIRQESELFNQMANRFLVNPYTRPTSKEVLLNIIHNIE
jgi:pimeloyl-ACP methyl ester carboxylesterase